MYNTGFSAEGFTIIWVVVTNDVQTKVYRYREDREALWVTLDHLLAEGDFHKEMTLEYETPSDPKAHPSSDKSDQTAAPGDVAEMLRQAYLNHTFDELVLVGVSAKLTSFKRELHVDVANRLVAELCEDHMQNAPDSLPNHLHSLLPLGRFAAQFDKPALPGNASAADEVLF